MLVNRLSIQSKLVLMMLIVSIGSVVVISTLGYVDRKASMTRGIENQLHGMLETKSNQLEVLLEGVQNQALTLASEEGTIRAMQGFKDAFRAIEAQQVSRPELKKWDDALAAFYRRDFLPRLARYLDAEPVLETYLPAGIAARFLQYQYIAANPRPYLRKNELDAAVDNTQYSALHARYQPRFRDVVNKFKYEDLMLIDPDTLDIVYTEEKTAEFATNLRTGPYSETALADVVTAVRKAMDRGDYKLADFEFYRPNLGEPNAFLASPIFDGPRMTGILVIQFPFEQLNRVMTGNREWENEGLGKTGEIYLVGRDGLLRSRTRAFLEHRDVVIDGLKRSGLPSSTLKRIEALDTLVLNLRVHTEAVRRALTGEAGIGIGRNYRDIPVLSAYAPVEVEGMRWAIIAEMEEDEAYAPIRSFGRKVLAYSAGIAVVVTLLATLLAGVLVKPIRRLTQGAKQVGDGGVGVEVEVNSHDEFRELADAFNEMTRNLKAKSDTIEQKVRENEELLLNILPGPIIARRRGGDERASEGFADVTVLFADVAGFTELSESVNPEEAVTLLNELIGAIDEAAERAGVEKVKTIGSSYMAVCGLSVQRPDHANRVVDFALDILRIVRRFNQEHTTSLAAEVGVNAGPVVGGIVGRSKFLYDLWGDTVNVARSIKADARPNTIVVTGGVKDRLHDAYEFESLGTVEVGGKGPLAAWSVKT